MTSHRTHPQLPTDGANLTLKLERIAQLEAARAALEEAQQQLEAAILAGAEAHLSNRQIAAAAGTTHPAVARVLRRLEESAR